MMVVLERTTRSPAGFDRRTKDHQDPDDRVLLSRDDDAKHTKEEPLFFLGSEALRYSWSLCTPKVPGEVWYQKSKKCFDEIN